MEMANSSSSTQGSQSLRQSIYKSPNDRKQALRTILGKIQTLHENSDPCALQSLEEAFKETDDIHDNVSLSEKVGFQDQVYIDSEVMNVSSMIIRTCTQNLTKECNAFSKMDFIEKLLRFVENLPDTTLLETNWSILENEIPNFNSTANYTCLLDWMNLSEQSIEVKMRKERKITDRNRESQKTIQRPDNVVQLEEEEKTIEKTVEKIRKLITRSYKANLNPIDFFQLILDPGDFGKTIENLLHVSFLIRDGHIQFSIDDSGTPLITPANKKVGKNREVNENSKLQNIMTLDIEQWQILKDAYGLATPMIDF